MATEAPASAFKARGTPEVLRIVEIMGIMQARSWGTCSVSIFSRPTFWIVIDLAYFRKLNEFRKFMGLKRKFSLLSPISGIFQSRYDSENSTSIWQFCRVEPGTRNPRA